MLIIFGRFAAFPLMSVLRPAYLRPPWLTNIPQRQRAQQGVADRMDQYVGVAVAHCAPCRRDRHPAQPEGPALRHLMKIDSEAYSHVDNIWPLRGFPANVWPSAGFPPVALADQYPPAPA